MSDDLKSPLAPLAFLPFGLVIVWWMLSPPPEVALRTIGGVAQLAGVALVLVAVDEALNPEKGPILVRLWRWLQRKIRKLLGKTKTVSLKVSKGIHAHHSSAGGSVDVGQCRAMSEIERRLGELEKAHERLSQQVSRVNARLDALWQKLDSKTDALRDSIKALEKANKAATLKRARWDLGGAAFFAQGIILTTWPEAIAQSLV